MADTIPPFQLATFSLVAVQDLVAMTLTQLVPLLNFSGAVVNLLTENLAGGPATVNLYIAPINGDDLTDKEATVAGTPQTTGAQFAITNTIANTLRLGQHNAYITSTDQLGTVQIAGRGTVTVVSAD